MSKGQVEQVFVLTHSPPLTMVYLKIVFFFLLYDDDKVIHIQWQSFLEFSIVIFLG